MKKQIPSIDDRLIEDFRAYLEQADVATIWSLPTEDDYESHMESILDAGMTYETLLEWGEAYPLTESFHSDQMLCVADLFNKTGNSVIIGSDQYKELEDEVRELISEYVPSQTILVEDVLSYFSIQNQEQLDEARAKRRSS